MFLYCPFNFYGLYRDVPVFISEFLFSLFFLRLARGLSVLLIFCKNELLVSWIFSIDFLFHILLISALIFIISFLLFNLNLIRSFFLVFQGRSLD